MKLFTKNDLRDGDVVHYRDMLEFKNDTRFVQGEDLVDEFGNICHELCCYGDNLVSISRNDNDLDIVEVYQDNTLIAKRNDQNELEYV